MCIRLMYHRRHLYIKMSFMEEFCKFTAYWVMLRRCAEMVQYWEVLRFVTE